MLRFELKDAAAVLEHLNTRTERAGEAIVPACDLKISVMRDAGVLDVFSPTLRELIYNVKAIDLAGTMPLRDAHLMFPLKRDEEMLGATVRLKYGVEQTITLADVRVDNFRITAHQGGSVQVLFRVQCKPDAWKEIPPLYLLQGQPTEVTIEAAPLVELEKAPTTEKAAEAVA